MTPPRRDAGRPINLTLVADHMAVGGAEVALLNLFRNLDPSKVRPRLVCLKSAGVLGGEFEEAGFPITVVPRSSRYDLRIIPRLMGILRRSRTDVVLVTHLHLGALTLGRFVARAVGRPSIVAPHGMDTVPATGRRTLPRHDVETLFLSDAMVLLARAQGRYLHDVEGVGTRPWNRIREVVIPNGIPLPAEPTAQDRRHARAELGAGPDDVVVGIVARLHPVKAHEVLFDAIAKLAPQLPRLRLVVIGTGPREAELHEMARTLGIEGAVRFLGVRRDVADLMPGLDIACLTSTYECAPLAVIEAMAAAVPVVATDVGAVRDMMTDGQEGYVVPVADSAALAERIAALAEDAALRARLGTAGRQRAESQFDVRETARGFENLLADLTAPRPRRRAG